MNQYRMTFKFRVPNEKLEYYFSIRDDESAKKHFTMQMCRLIKDEGLQFDQLFISQDGCSISVIFEKKEYLAGRLAYVPARFKSVDDGQLAKIKMESITNALHKYCKTVKIGYYKTLHR